MADQKRTNWVIVGSPDNFKSTRDLGFTIQGLKTRHRKKAEQMKPGDRITWYITGRKAFAGTATVTSEYYEDHTIIWKSTNKNRSDETYPWRFEIKPDIILDDDDFVDAEPIARQMHHASKWPEANWTLAFQGNIRDVDDHDFELIESAIQDAARETVSSR